ncbi:copper transporter 6-like [Selaginella moellendorffii]|uniref:copper transporter 6-like n=1 Tax=Selaginella moellendorffii TaxID=88036 RepID=UPI000D1CAC95|nr:copper transporter 6-like [Selaginella moellendorffii]|eukprot:XP_024519166.1 copper transporter 6-like [Selaginella moellendorffii]
MDMDHGGHDHNQAAAPSNPSMGMGTGMHNMMMMQMSFIWSKNVTLLFSGWTTSNWVEYSLTLLAVVCFAILHQFLCYLRGRGDMFYSIPGRGQAAIALVLYAAYVSTSYLLMLIVMSFNVGVFIAVVLGLCLGILVFPFKLESNKTTAADHQHQHDTCSTQP